MGQMSRNRVIKMASLSPVPALKDLRVTFHDYSLVFPSQQTQKQSIFLSNMDQILNYNVPTLHFFKPNPDFPPQNVAKSLKIALERVLVPYDFMAGTLELNHKTGCLEIDCNGAGAGFVVASSELSLDEIENYLAHPNFGYHQLAVQRLENLADQPQPLCVFQITSFKCGGFAMGMSTDHILFDGKGAKIFLENLASQAFDDKPLAMVPCNNRRLLEARSPPRVEFPHPELLNLNLPVGEGSSPPAFDVSREELEFRIFKLSSTDIANLKNKARVDSKNTKISSFGVFAALIWQCKAFSGEKKDKFSTLLMAFDVRSRLNPPLPPSYSGNAVLSFGVSATYEELENAPFSKVVEMIAEKPKEVTDEYVKSAIDWLQVHRGILHGDYIVSSWLSLGFDEVVYPWGKPIYSCPVVTRKNICRIFHDAMDGGVGAMVALPAQEMENFECLFHKFLASSN